ncbi:hypothetical protein RI129_012407 [Pyrocoelia pectoralis]|uniref:Cytochrome P450 n=1 Tax=Pyrocoelia pectoralis TaxID=417401 RepID=A0AAN7UXX0_9COLE
MWNDWKIFNHTFYKLLPVIFLFWYIRHLWGRRKLYQMARQRPRPFALPLVGSAFYLLTSSNDIFETIFKFAKQFKSPTPLWLGSKLFFVVWDPKNLKIILNNPNALGKSDFYRFVENSIGTGLIMREVPKWKRHRKIMAPIFNQKTLKGFMHVFDRESSVLEGKLKEQVGRGSFNIYYYTSLFAMNILCETGMGVTSRSQTSNRDYIECIDRAKEITFSRINNVFYQSDWIFNLSSLSRELKVVTKRIEMYIDVFNVRFVLVQNLRKVKSPTFLRALIELTKWDNDFSEKDLLEEVNTFIIAGNDTITLTINYTLIMLGMHPEIQQKVYQEAISEAGNVQYLDAVLRETLRLFPPAPSISRKVEADIKLESCTIPAGASVAIAIIALHRDPDVWPDPLRFDPERFMGENVRQPYSWIPFSGGPRNCIAPQYAFMALKVVITALVKKYEFSTEYKSVADIKFKANLLLDPVNGFKVSIKLRQ